MRERVCLRWHRTGWDRDERVYACAQCGTRVINNPDVGESDGDVRLVCMECVTAASQLEPTEPVQVHGYAGHCAECFVEFRYPGYGSKLARPWFDG